MAASKRGPDKDPAEERIAALVGPPGIQKRTAARARPDFSLPRFMADNSLYPYSLRNSIRATWAISTSTVCAPDFRRLTIVSPPLLKVSLRYPDGVAALKDAHHIDEIMAAIDTSKDGLIQYEEFKVFVASGERELRKIFESVDADNSGHIDKEELKAALVEAGIVVDRKLLDKFFETVDRDNDGGMGFVC